LANVKRGVFEKDVPGVEKNWCWPNQLQRPLAHKDVVYK